ncbi:uncharacterized mitochondrial protein AtMg00810-like [Humulus lupulus]|uniref:uncharacterized mitochondrial protein AtMg00810-like n=1 Tax=Humulus lupulus TaxID=3486 RepID=UPI002B416FDB|nr:uncharacterized mitochondrial protein AtMg00810-like [Humulus lupulus]
MFIHTLVILIYVDDIILTGSSSVHLSQLLTFLKSQFAIKDLDPLHYFLGVEVHSSFDCLHLSQTKYIRDLLQKTGMLDSKPLPTPLAHGSLSQHDGLPLSSATEYRSILGALQYCTLTRFDISFAVNKLCQFMHAPTDVHLKAVKHVLRYLKGTGHYGLSLHCHSAPSLVCYTDADWASCPDDRRSISSYCVFFGNNLISWSSSKQKVVSCSSTESEYRALANGAAELSWIQSLHELHLPLSAPPILYCDNISTLRLASNPVLHSRTKHVEIDQHFVCEKVARHAVQLAYALTAEQIVDCLTKPLVTARFQELRFKLTILPRPVRLRGDVKQ